MNYEARFTLPLPPSANALYVEVTDKKTGKRKRVKTRALRDYRQAVFNTLLVNRVYHTAWQNAIELGYEAHIYVRTKGADTSNRLKALEDCLQDALDFNDNKFVHLEVTRHVDPVDPRVEMRLYVIS